MSQLHAPSHVTDSENSFVRSPLPVVYDHIPFRIQLYPCLIQPEPLRIGLAARRDKHAMIYADDQRHPHTRISSTIPVYGVGISTTALSVSTSMMMSPSLTSSPTDIRMERISPSWIPSPRSGKRRNGQQINDLGFSPVLFLELGRRPRKAHGAPWERSASLGCASGFGRRGSQSGERRNS